MGHSLVNQYRQVKWLFCILGILLYFNISKVRACTCNELNSVKEEIQSSDFVGIGQIIDIEYFSSGYARIISDSIKTYDLIKYQVIVSKVYKGSMSSDTIAVFSGLGHTDCGISLENGETYIIYADSEYSSSRPNYPFGENIYWTTICKRTGIYDDKEISKIEKQLRKKKKNDP